MPTDAPEAPHPLDESKGGVRSPQLRKLARDGTTWTPTEKVTRDRLMRQFCRAGRKGVEVTSGNSEAYQRGWAAIFGTPAEKARALVEIEVEKDGEEALARMEQAIADAEAVAFATPMPSPCKCGSWLHQDGCPTGRRELDRFVEISR